MTIRMLRLLGRVAGCIVIAILCIGCGSAQTQAVSTPTLASAPVPTMPPTDDVKEIVRRWLSATDSLKSSRVMLTLTPVRADGSKASIPPEFTEGIPTSFEMIREAVPNGHFRYKVIFHLPMGDAIALYDGKHSYRHVTWSKEVYRPLGEEVYKAGEYWDDEYFDRVEGMMRSVIGSGPIEDGNYKFVGRQEVKGRRLVEIEIVSDLADISGDRIYLDESNYLPYRVLHFVNGGKLVVPNSDFVAFEVMTEELITDYTVPASDYVIPVPQDPIWVYDQLLAVEVLTSSQQMAKVVDFNFFEPQGGSGDAYIYTSYITERNGKQSRVTATNTEKGELIQGSYLPEDVDPGAGISQGRLSVTQTDIDINGLPGKLNFYFSGEFHSLRFTRDGTSILIRSKFHDDAKEKAMELARGLQPVPKTP